MNLLIKIKNILLKFLAWLIHFFMKKRTVKNKSKANKKRVIVTKKTFKASINRDEALSDLVIATYPGVLPKELESLNKKIDAIKKKILGYNEESIQDELDNIKKISEIVKNNKILTNQIDELDELVESTLYDENLHLNTNEKISILKDNIEVLFDDNLKDYEKHIIKKAYYEYDEVNYVIVTTMLIDELTEELESVYENYNKNRYDKQTFIDKVREIEKKLERLRKINDREEVEREIETLKSDLDTKRKDKYDLLYNNEIFINIQRQCDQLLEQVDIKGEQKKAVITEKRKEERKQEEIKKEKRKKETEKKKEENKEEKNLEENILKRFMDLELARQILLKRELESLKQGKSMDVVDNTVLSYQEFLIGEFHEFNFLRNKIKLEVAKLYNDTLRNICILDNGPFIPIEHINIKLSDLVQETIDNQQRLNNLILEKKKVSLEETEISTKVSQKLGDILEREKKREEVKGKPKVLVRTYNPITSNEEKTS